jgi:hypothetical protein
LLRDVEKEEKKEKITEMCIWGLCRKIFEE